MAWRWWMVLGAGVMAASAQTAPSQASFHLLAERTSFFVGEQVRLTPVVRSDDGALRTGVRVLWSSDNPAIVSIADGVVTGRGVGVTRIRATVDGEPNRRAELNLQALPRRIEITPENARMTTGESLQFQARALDINNQPIAGVTFNWRVFFDSRSGNENNTITPGGRLTALVAGRMHVAANLPLPFGVFAGAQALEATVPVLVEPPKHYEIKAIWRSSKRAESAVFELPANLDDPLIGNERGQLVFQAVLNQRTRGVVMWDQGSFRLLTSTGDPSPGRLVLRQTLTAFGPGSLNEAGQYLVQADAQGWFQILMNDERGLRPVFLDGSAEAYNPLTRRNEPFYLSGPRVTRSSLTDNGTSLAWFSMTPLVNRSQQHSSLFTIFPAGRMQEVASNRVPLPGLDAGWSVKAGHYGLTNSSRAFFAAVQSGREGLYLVEPESTGENPKVGRVLSIGDTFDGGRVSHIEVSTSPASTYAGRDGELLAGIGVEGRGPIMLRWPDGNVTSAPELLRSCNCGVYSSRAGGTLLRNQGAGQGGPGVLLWKRDGSVERIMPVGAELPNGERVTAIQGATMDANGRIFVFVATANTASTLVSIAGGERTILLRTGDKLPLQPRTAIRPLLEGRGAGEPWSFSSGGSLLRFKTEGEELRMAVNGVLPESGGTRFGGTFDEFQGAEGEDGVEFATPAGLFRARADEAVERVLGAPITPDVATINRMGLPAKDQTRVFFGTSRRGGTSLLWYPPGEAVREILFLGSTAETRPRVDDVDLTAPFNRAWATEDRRVVSEFFTAANGVVTALWENGTWRAIGVPGRTRLEGNGQLVTTFQSPRTGAGRIFAQLILADGTMVIAEWTGSAWTPVVSRLNRLPNGTIPTWAASKAINNQAELLVETGEGAMAVRRADGSFRYVLQQGDLLDGDSGMRILNATLRDDGTIYLLGSSQLGEQVVYRATPIAR